VHWSPSLADLLPAGRSGGVSLPRQFGVYVEIVGTIGIALFNLDWITRLVIAVVSLVGAAYFVVARPDKRVGGHLHDELEPTGAERHG
jgi:hypothetical protein